MDDPVLVGVLDRLADRLHQRQDFAMVEIPVLDILIEVNAVDQFHGVVIHAVTQAAVIDPSDVRMLEASSQLDFPLEPA